MAGQLVPLDGLPGRFASVSYDAERKMIVVKIDDTEGNLMSEMSWGYTEPEIIEEPASEHPADGASDEHLQEVREHESTFEQ